MPSSSDLRPHAQAVGGHLQGPTRRVATGLGQDVGALAHEAKVPPVEGEVMRVSVDEAGGSACRGDTGDM